MNEFYRGARIRPKPERRDTPINQEIPFYEFMAMVGIYALRDYKVDRATFLKYAEAAFEAAGRAVNGSENSRG